MLCMENFLKTTVLTLEFVFRQDDLIIFIGIYYTYLSYPKISYTVGVSTVVSTNFKSEFYEAGINQVLHRISVSVC